MEELEQPQARDSVEDKARPRCAYCDSADTELFSIFGQTLLGSQYYCHNCHSVFEVVRFEEE